MKGEKRSSLTLRLPRSLREWLAAQSAANFTSQNDEIIRSIRERMQMAAGHVASETGPAVIEQNAALQGGLPTTQDERTV